MKRIFVRYVSHEIRTPLNSAYLGLQFLREHLFKYDDIDHNNVLSTINIIDEIKHSVDIAVNILNDLLVYEKLEGNIMQLHCKNIDMQQLVVDSIRPLTLQVLQASFTFYI